MSEWKSLNLKATLYANADEDAVVGFQTAIENGFITELGGHTRFPGLTVFATLPDPGKVYLSDWNGNLVAATSNGRVFTIDTAGNVTDRTDIRVAGGRRVIFAKTALELAMAAGGPITRLRDMKTELLSDNAPLSSHVQSVDNRLLASELNSQRFYHTPPGQPDVWDPLDTYAADGDPDQISGLIVTPFKEVMIGGPRSIEQFEVSTSGDGAFRRRWSIGEGVGAPYAMLCAGNSFWTVNKLYEMVQTSGQTAISASTEISKILEAVDDWEDAWLGGYPDSPLHVGGEKFILFQIPNATNSHGSKGITLLYNYRLKKWSELYGFDLNIGTPIRWPGWSHWTVWSRTFVGGEGLVYEVSDKTYNHGPGQDPTIGAGTVARWLVRTSYMTATTKVAVNRLRLTLKRGTSTVEGFIAVRCRRDGKPFGAWIRRSLGKIGDRSPIISFPGFGTGYSFMFEISTADDVPIELIKAEVELEARGG